VTYVSVVHEYEGHGVFPGDCTGPAGSVGAAPSGTEAFATGILAHWPEVKFRWGWGAYCRPVRGSKTRLSSHGSGRGVDCYPPVAGGEYGWAVAHRLAELHLELGVQYIIFDGKQIGGTSTLLRRDPWKKWRAYGNRAAGDHADHLHIELRKDASTDLTFLQVSNLLRGEGFAANSARRVAVAQCAVQNPKNTVGVWANLSVTAAGHVVARNGAFHAGDLLTASLTPSAPIVDVVSFGPRGYWLLGADGGVFGFGDAPYPSGHAEFFRQLGGRLLSPITSGEMVGRGDGAVLVLHAAGDLGVFNLGSV